VLAFLIAVDPDAATGPEITVWHPEHFTPFTAEGSALNFLPQDGQVNLINMIQFLAPLLVLTYPP